MKKLIGLLLCLCFVSMALSVPINSVAETIDSIPLAELMASVKVHTPPKYEKFELACSIDEMLYGIPTADINGRTYGFASGGLYSIDSSERNDEELVVKCDGDNINHIGTTIFFTTFEDETARIKSFDTKTHTLTEISNTKLGKIKQLYIINNLHILFLSNGAVYRCSIDGKNIEQISTLKNIISFAPTDSGILYELRSDRNFAVYLDDMLIIDNETYYSIKMDHFIAMVDGTLYQIPMSELRSIVYTHNKINKELDVLPYMSNFDLYGIYDVMDILGSEDNSHECAYCENGEEQEVFSFDYKADIERTAGIEVASPNVAGDMIVEQARIMKEYRWTPALDLRSYPNRGVITTFTGGEEVVGVPYSREKLFSDSYQSKCRTITYNGSSTVSNSLYISLSCFGNEASNANSLIYEAKTACPDAGPLYGCDCSEYICYSWRIGRRGSGQFDGTSFCTRIATSVSNLSNLKAGDALIDAGNHCVLIKSVSSNSVVVWEQTPPKIKATTYRADATGNTSLSKFFELFGSFYVYRLNTFELTFNSNGGSSVSPTSYTVASGFKLGTFVPLPTPTRTNYNFIGWYTSATGGTKITSNSSITSNTTVYAHWIMESVADGGLFIIPQQYTLSDELKRKSFK